MHVSVLGFRRREDVQDWATSTQVSLSCSVVIGKIPEPKPEQKQNSKEDNGFLKEVGEKQQQPDCNKAILAIPKTLSLIFFVF